MRYEEYTTEYYSDHTPMFLQINLDTLRSSYGIGKMPRKRRLYSKGHENVRKYVLHKTKLCQHYQISKNNWGSRKTNGEPRLKSTEQQH
jgi:hypothetical protein